MSHEMRSVNLAADKPIIGFGLCMGSERVAEMVGSTNFDFAMVDLLHSHFDKRTATGAIRALAATNGPVPFARVADNTPGTINGYLDAGAMGIIVPMVESAQEAEHAVMATYYPPMGTRSKGSLGSFFYGSEYFSKFNESVSLVVMIETPQAAANAKSILSVSGLSGCLIGSGDLSYILKEKNRSDELHSLIKGVIDAGKELNVPIGLAVSAPEEIQFWWNQGVDFFLVSHDMGILSTAVKLHDSRFTEVEVEKRG